MTGFLLKILTKLLCVITSIALVFAPITRAVNSGNYEKAESFEKVYYENQLIPELDEDGCWTFTTDRDFKVVQLTDIH
ncbi:MAG: hypothetical protein UHL70_07855, partial [Acutalibacteraceae bacterium]|nr:hypothetical protein [Acutalibacteraceae bacterium]